MCKSDLPLLLPRKLHTESNQRRRFRVFARDDLIQIITPTAPLAKIKKQIG